MWRLPEAKAESRPAFVTLMYHGRDTRAYDVADDELDAYVEGRVAHVRAGDPTPIDLRLTNGEIIRFQCTKLPDGGRMLSYTDVTDIVARADELQRLHGALDAMEQGIILLDSKLNVEFMNVAVRRQWQLPEEYRGDGLAFADLVGNARKSQAFGMTGEPLELYIQQRISRVRAGDTRPMDIRHADGRIVRSQCCISAQRRPHAHLRRRDRSGPPRRRCPQVCRGVVAAPPRTERPAGRALSQSCGRGKVAAVPAALVRRTRTDLPVVAKVIAPSVPLPLEGGGCNATSLARHGNASVKLRQRAKFDGVAGGGVPILSPSSYRRR